jgi:quercetin dioxygenase-like cupin family protein
MLTATLAPRRSSPPPVAEPAAVGADEGERRWGGDGLVNLRLVGRRTGDRVSLIELHMPAGATTPLHRQPYDDETLYVLEGRLTIHLDGVQHTVERGGAVFIPRETPHALRADKDARLLLYGLPAGQERYFRAVSVPATELEPPPQVVAPHPLAAIAMQQRALLNGVELMGDAPFG